MTSFLSTLCAEIDNKGKGRAPSSAALNGEKWSHVAARYK
jgi:hypothetical protein